jgi:hypothetical protein
MPTVALHSHYWQTQAPEPVIGPGASGSGGYPNWQMNILRAVVILWIVAQ